MLVHTHYQIRGGEDSSFAAERDLLLRAGYEVDTFVADNQQLAGRPAQAQAADTIWSRHAYHALRKRLQYRPADLVHVHNFFPLLSPAIHHAAKAESAATVQTLHNYRLICPSGIFYRDHGICEDCMGRGLAWPAVLHRCYRGSRSASAVVASMLSVHHLLGTWRRHVDRYVALTRFARAKFIEGGLPRDRIAVKPNFVEDPGVGRGTGNYALFAGRLTEEKGVRLLLDTWRAIGEELPLKIMGAGPLANEIAMMAGRVSGVSFAGERPPDEVQAAMADAACCIVASAWYEGFPRVIVESLAAGTPIIAPRIGGLGEIVEHGESGLLFAPGDSGDLLAAVRDFMAQADQRRLRINARQRYLACYSPSANLAALTKIYEAALEASRGPV